MVLLYYHVIESKYPNGDIMKTMIEIKHPEQSILLAIGCGDGRELENLSADKICGIDVDIPALCRAHLFLRKKGRKAEFRMAPAEDLPYPDHYFTDIMARVSLPYTDIQQSLNEIARVAKPGCNIFITMHDWKMQWNWMKEAAKNNHWKRVIDCSYVFLASWIYAATGKCIRKPWNGLIETFQTQHRLRKQLWAAGLTITHMARTKHIEIVAVKSFNGG